MVLIYLIRQHLARAFLHVQITIFIIVIDNYFKVQFVTS